MIGVIAVGAGVLSAVAGIAMWISTMRQIDRVTLLLRVMTTIPGMSRLLMRRHNLCRVTMSNGFEVSVPGTMMKPALEEVLKFKMRDDDVIVATYAKSGTTWMQEIAWLICNNADIDAANTTKLTLRYGFLESPNMPGFGHGLQSLEKWPKEKKRFIKTHLPFEVFPQELQKQPKGKTIFVVRNPKDTCVSFFHFHRMTQSLPEPGTWNDFLTKFCYGQVSFGSWFDHVYKYWQVYKERKDSIYFVSFEALKRNLKGEITKLATYLEKDLTEDQIEAISEHCTFSSMSKNKSTNYSDVAKTGAMDFKTAKFMRKGEVGDWKNFFTINQNKAFDEMYQERTKDWDLTFDFELSG